MDTINERIQLIVDEYYNGNISAFCRGVGLKQPTMNTILGVRKSKPSFDVINAIVGNTKVGAEWLITGKGEMFKQARESISIANNEGISNSQIGNNIGNNQISLALPSAGKQKIIDSAGKITTIEINNADDIRIAQLRREYEVLIQRIAELERTISAQEKLINMYEKNS